MRNLFFVLRLIGLAIVAILALPFVATYVVVEAIGLLFGQLVPDLAPKYWNTERHISEA